MQSQNILVAPMNWGLGHAARCIPIIRELQIHGFTPVLASDGAALKLLKLEFPELQAHELPSYNITYARHGNFLKWQLLLQSPHIMRTIKRETLAIAELTKTHSLKGIISDNRFGAFHPEIPSVFITHQLKVLSGITTPLTSKIHRRIINRFDQCWVPDSCGSDNLSGILAHPKILPKNVQYIGILSRFEKRETELEYDYLVLLSGPEPQRSLLENKLLQKLNNTSKIVLFVRGLFDACPLPKVNSKIIVKNHLFGTSLETALNSSKLIIARSGYTTLMDLAKLEKKAFFIPTPGQPEQKYLATRLKNLGIASCSTQNSFNVDKLAEADSYSGLRAPHFSCDFGQLFSLFKSK